jgi:hypothetical protein
MPAGLSLKRSKIKALQRVSVRFRFNAFTPRSHAVEFQFRFLTEIIIARRRGSAKLSVNLTKGKL